MIFAGYSTAVLQMSSDQLIADVAEVLASASENPENVRQSRHS